MSNATEDDERLFRKQMFQFIAQNAGALAQYMGGISTDNFYQWQRGLRPIPPLRARQIDEFSEGQFSKHRIRPDIFGPPSVRAA